MAIMKVRGIAALIIDDVITNRHSLDVAIAKQLKFLEQPQDKALLQQLCYGCLRWFHQLNYISKLLLTNPKKKLDSAVHALLLLGLYQLIYMRVPVHAAIYETVDAAVNVQKSWAKGLLNAALRNFLRRKDDLLDKATTDLEAQYSHPLWLIKLLQQSWPQDWDKILINNNLPPPMHVRVNIQAISRADYFALLLQADIPANISEHTKCGITLTQSVDVTRLPGFAEGFVSVQDIAAQLVAEELDLQPGLRVLDACAAPGGKTTHILELAPSLCEVVALELDNKRLQRITENLSRLRLQATVINGDALQADAWWDGKPFDRILLDVPCSATGVIRRHPDIKLLRQASDIAKLVRYQQQLLTAAWPLLAPGGLMIYATCSILALENTTNIEWFLSSHQDASVEPGSCSMPSNVTPYGQQFLPEDGGSDGFYYVRLRKNLHV